MRFVLPARCSMLLIDEHAEESCAQVLHTTDILTRLHIHEAGCYSIHRVLVEPRLALELLLHLASWRTEVGKPSEEYALVDFDFCRLRHGFSSLHSHYLLSIIPRSVSQFRLGH